MGIPFRLELPPLIENPPPLNGPATGLEYRPFGQDGPSLLEALSAQPRLSLLWGSQAPTRSLLAAATTLAADGLSVRLFDGGNAFDGYFVARLARRLALRASRPPDPYDILERIRLSRAFTCFQLAELLSSSPAGPEPLFVLDLLATFYDESVPLRDTERLLANVLTHLRRLAEAGPVIVGAREPQSLVKDRWLLLDQLQAAADTAWMLRPPAAQPPLQPRLFP
jgi:hypothetical protein